MSSSQRRLEQAVDATLNSIYRQSVNPLRKDAYLKMSKCFDLNDQKDIDQCVQKCNYTVEYAQEVIQREMNVFQERLQRCSYICQDEATDYLDSFPTQSASLRQKAEEKMSKCIDSCVDKHLNLLVATEAKIVADIRKNQPL